MVAGRAGEDAAAQYLETHGHKVIARNWKTKWCEIDIISQLDDVLYFTEVKYRHNGSGLDAITPKKLTQMRFAADLYLKDYPGASAQLAAIAVSGDNYEVTDFLVLE
jgi:Holliday junction resolvase-like predicted endonuclease